ncbi:hypothetical protein A9404_05545 [Halothiobacillus diazotrophicus]|uniref:Peptidase M48 domain-containing protein n=1 Tax=Halothiobacillus diazotrophicus TaxID=1860122 RepID=A0A191ZGD3_9GAMM|nr:M48 family metalloprotease [Halothiobacillus diazotrophicus]ANJ66915.1 hypothetical protein A9404_05545 [Halothiobacillus diazotrophicus]
MNKIAAPLILVWIFCLPGLATADSTRSHSNFSSLNSQLPDLGDPVDQTLSKAEEQKIGAEVFEKLRSQVQFIDDPLLLRYLNDLGDRLMASAPGTRFPPNFMLINSPTINAFTVPGGYIAVYSGLFLFADNESELAGVLAHEIAHATHRHIAQMLSRQSGNSALVIAGFVAALLLGSINPDMGAAAAASSVAGATQNEINFTRMHEREADEFAIQTLQRVHIDPHGLVSFFEKLQRQSGDNGAAQYAFLLTHPLNNERISAAEDRIAAIPREQLGTRDSLSFQLARARLAGLTGATKIHLGTPVGESYRQAVLDQAHGNWTAARSLLDKLYRTHPGNLWFGLPLAQVLFAHGHTKEAQSLMDELLALYPGNAILLRQSVHWLIKTGNPDQAYKTARAMMEQDPGNRRIVLSAAEAAAAAGDHLGSHELLGKYFLMGNQLVAAHQEYELAFSYSAGDSLAQERLDAALKQIESRARP